MLTAGMLRNFRKVSEAPNAVATKPVCDVFQLCIATADFLRHIHFACVDTKSNDQLESEKARKADFFSMTRNEDPELADRLRMSNHWM